MGESSAKLYTVDILMKLTDEHKEKLTTTIKNKAEINTI